MELIIQNNGEIEPEALTLIGASSKREQTGKIGLFGSGNKYAIAYLLRNGYAVDIYSGTKKIEITTIKRTFREKEYEVVVVDGKETSITLDMGPKWKLWQAVREIYSNAIDEEGERLMWTLPDMPVQAEPHHKEGTTTFYIRKNESAELLEIYDNFDNYFSKNRNPECYTATGAVYKRKLSSGVIYRRGIRCSYSLATIFDYELPNVEINESRVIEYEFKAKKMVWKLLLECDKDEIVEHFLANVNGDKWENNEWAKDTGDTGFSPAWKRVLEGKYVAPELYAAFVNDKIVNSVYFVPNALYTRIIEELGEEYNGLKSVGGDKVKWREYDASVNEWAAVQRAQRFLKAGKINIVYPIKIVEFLSDGVCGFADRKEQQILVGVNSIEKGVHWVASVIFEEYVHLKHNVNDETREMQNTLIDELMNTIKKITGEIV